MLDALKKRFFATQKEEVDMSNPTEQEVSAKELVEAVTADTKLSDALAAATELNTSQASALAELTSKLEAAQAALAIIEADKASMIAEAATAKLASRKDKVVEMIGTERADALMTATANMEDAAFDAVLVAMSVATEKEANSAMFKEIGVSGEVDASKIEEDPVSRLAAKLATQFNVK